MSWKNGLAQLGKVSPTANIFGEIEWGRLTEEEARDLFKLCFAF
ncbi:hypothetical protein BGS_0245 [Beggiatoa sp. SS]|nr:hypothetical protein BGS_0245 [Beggiatoa sp. SS]